MKGYYSLLASCFAHKYQTKVEVTDNDKHSFVVHWDGSNSDKHSILARSSLNTC
jgi:hypothetical protein